MTDISRATLEQLRDTWRAEEAEFKRLASEHAAYGGTLYVGNSAKHALTKRHADELADALLSSSSSSEREQVIANVSEIREGEENEGPLESTDLYVNGRGIALLVNVPAGSEAYYSLIVDHQSVKNGTVGSKAASSGIAVPAAPIESLEYQARNAAENRPCGTARCVDDFPGMPSRWCSGCLIDALLMRLR